MFTRAVKKPLPRELYKPADGTDTESWEPFIGPLFCIPENRREVYQYYGNPGVAAVDPVWERSHMVVAKNLPGVPSGKLYVHKLAEPYLREALRRAESLCKGTISKIGCFNFRHQRHDSSRPLSYHAWGVAVDICPEKNAPRIFPATGTRPQEWSTEWQTIWPTGVQRELVVAFESVGWQWGGRWERFCDPMHFQLVR